MNQALGDIAQQRLRTQSLSKPRFDTVVEVVTWLGAVQAQDYPAAKWSVGQRMTHATDSVIEQAFNGGSILRTHVMRPTWHFVMPEDIRWMLALTAPRVKAILAPYDRDKLEITEKLLAQTYKVFAKALKGNNYLTRQALADELEQHDIIARGQRLGHLVMHAELDGLVCSGPRKGKQFTYALLDERVPRQKTISREEARARLAEKYFTSHGPAQLKDFAWWSGLMLKDATEGLESIRSRLSEETVEGKTYWFASKANAPVQAPKAWLLSIYDEYVIAYKDRSALGGERFTEKFLSMGNALTSVLVIDGSIVGTWKRTLAKDLVGVDVSPLRLLTIPEKKAIQATVERYGVFLRVPVKLKYVE